MSDKTICRTVAELIAALQQLPPDLVPFSYEHPPFTGVALVQQTNRKVMIGPADERESKANPVGEIVLPDVEDNYLIEQRAAEIYDGFVYDGLDEKPAWTPGGNSTMQDRARRIARLEIEQTSDDETTGC